MKLILRERNSIIKYYSSPNINPSFVYHSPTLDSLTIGSLTLSWCKGIEGNNGEGCRER